MFTLSLSQLFLGSPLNFSDHVTYSFVLPSNNMTDRASDKVILQVRKESF